MKARIPMLLLAETLSLTPLTVSPPGPWQLIVDIALKRIDPLSAFLFYLVERIMIRGD